MAVLMITSSEPGGREIMTDFKQAKDIAGVSLITQATSHHRPNEKLWRYAREGVGLLPFERRWFQERLPLSGMLNWLGVFFGAGDSLESLCAGGNVFCVR